MKQTSVITSVVIFSRALDYTNPTTGKTTTKKAIVNVHPPIGGVKAFYFTEGEIKALSQCVNGQVNLLPTLAVGGTLEIETLSHKVGETWVNKGTGETGAYTKDWVSTRATGLTLSMRTAATMASIAEEKFSAPTVAEPAKKAEAQVILPD